jgi:hypothetical protein
MSTLLAIAILFAVALLDIAAIAFYAWGLV